MFIGLTPPDGQPRRGDMFCLPNHMPLLWSFDLSPFRCYRHGAPTVLGTIRLTGAPSDGSLGGFSEEMKVCTITGSRRARGSVIHRRGLAKKKGGVGRHITKMVPRIFAPNLRRQRIWVPELKKFVRIRVTARGLKTINKHGAYKALKKSGAI